MNEQKSLNWLQALDFTAAGIAPYTSDASSQASNQRLDSIASASDRCGYQFSVNYEHKERSLTVHGDETERMRRKAAPDEHPSRLVFVNG